MNYEKNSTVTPFQKKKAFDISNDKHPVQEEIQKLIGTYNLTATFTEDTETLRVFKHIPGLISFTCHLSLGNEIIGVGRGTATLNSMNKFLDKTIRYAFNASLIDAVVRSTKVLDTLPLGIDKQNIVENIEEDLEGRDKIAHFHDEDLQTFATDKQKTFLIKLIDEKCDDQTKNEYLNQLHSPYFSKFDCSKLINSLLN